MDRLSELIEKEMAAADAVKGGARAAHGKPTPSGAAHVKPPSLLERASVLLLSATASLRLLQRRAGVSDRALLLGAVLLVALVSVLSPLHHSAGLPTLLTRAAPLPTLSTSPFYNAHHSPVGAFASFTLGFKGASGGLGLEQAGSPMQPVYVMLETADLSALQTLPFFYLPTAVGGDPAFYSQMGNALGERTSSRVLAFADADIQRALRLGSDTWTAGDLTFRILSPPHSVPDPQGARVDDTQLADAVIPAVLVEIVVDNRGGRLPRRVVFGYQGSEPNAGGRRMDASLLPPGAVGIAHGLSTGIATDAPGAVAAQGFALSDVLADGKLANRSFALGNQIVLVASVPAGEVSTFHYAVSFFRGGAVTSGSETKYLYTRFHDSLESVASRALSRFGALRARAVAADALLEAATHLSVEQRWQVAHSVRSYYGSSQLLETPFGKPVWVVNEGEYRMMNTFDLTVDQLFFELDKNPWTVRNVLDHYTARYSYNDTLRFPAGEEDGGALSHPGGLTWTHDMGVANAFSPPGHSAYEQGGLSGLFSFMSSEQLVNWVLCATAYAATTGDAPWLSSHEGTLRAALASLQARDHPDQARRDGLMSLDSDRCGGGAEITTYDSLDVSLGRARGNVYLGGKTWAAYVCLEATFYGMGLETEAAAARQQADRAAATVAAALLPGGRGLPAVLGAGGSNSSIIPAIEGLVFPSHCGAAEALAPDGRYKAYLAALRLHLSAVLKPGICLFPDGGWKLSSTSDNSWLSKVYLSQHVARAHLGLAAGDSAAAAADAAHVGWLLHPEQSVWSWSDQMLAGVATGSRYYPRGVTSWLWLQEGAA